ncbi:MAG: hypothetical protein ACK4FB_10010 [Brevundimonas sp.]
MSPSLSPERKIARTWKALGAPVETEAVLAFGPRGIELARAAHEILQPRALTLLHDGPPPARARFDTCPDTLAQIAAARPGAFDLVLAGGGLETASLGRIRDDLGRIVEILRPGGTLAAVIDTLGAPDPDGACDALLFPHLARQGELGDEPRTLLPAAAWILLFQTIGLEIRSVQGLGEQEMSPDMVERHAARLQIYDSGELGTGRLHLVAGKPGDSA